MTDNTTLISIVSHYRDYLVLAVILITASALRLLFDGSKLTTRVLIERFVSAVVVTALMIAITQHYKVDMNSVLSLAGYSVAIFFSRDIVEAIRSYIKSKSAIDSIESKVKGKSKR